MHPVSIVLLCIAIACVLIAAGFLIYWNRDPTKRIMNHRGYRRDPEAD